MAFLAKRLKLGKEHSQLANSPIAVVDWLIERCWGLLNPKALDKVVSLILPTGGDAESY